MSNINDFKTPSHLHKVIIENQGFTIQPANETKEAYANFQAIAKNAIKCVNDNYKIIPHLNGDSLGYESIFFQQVIRD